MPKILGERFKQARKNLDLSVEDLVKKTTFSKQQIQQIEDGGYSAFYSLAIKFQSAKKVADILGLSHEEAFEMPKIESEIDPEPEVLMAPQTPALVVNIVESKKKMPSQVPTPLLKASKARAWAFWGVSAALLVGVGWVVFAPMLEADPALTVVQVPKSTSATKEEVKAESVVEQVQQSNSEQVQTSSATPLKNSNPSSCSLFGSSASPILKYTPPKASKAGNQVYVLNKGEAQAICFEDVAGSIQQMTVLPNEGFNFSGKPPFKIISKSLNQFDVYYQGYRVKPDVLGQAIILQEAQIQ